MLSPVLKTDLPAVSKTHQQGWHARLELGFEKRAQRSVLAHRLHQGPLVVQKPLYPEGDGICHAVIVHPPGGIAGGDELSVIVDLTQGAHALITTPGATKWYRSSGPQAQQRIHLRVADGAILEWLPQENIVFDAANIDMLTSIELETGARAVGWDITCLGRTASQERFLNGCIKQGTDLRIATLLAWTERMQLNGDDPLLHSPVGISHHTVFGTLWLAGIQPDRFLLETLRAKPFAAGIAGVTALPHVTLIRAVAQSSEALRHYFINLWQLARPHCLGVDAIKPRIWAT